MYKVIKWIRGRAYLYLQRSYRAGGKVRTECRCLGAASTTEIRTHQQGRKVAPPTTTGTTQGQPLRAADGWGGNTTKNLVLPLDSRIDFTRHKLDGHALYKEWEDVCRTLRSVGIDTSTLPAIKLRYGKSITHKKDWRGKCYIVTLPKTGTFQRTQFKREFSKAVARIRLDLLRQQKPDDYLKLAYQFDQSFRATQHALHTYILHSKDRKKLAKALALRWWGNVAQLQRNIPVPEKVGITDYSQRQSWEDEAVALMATLQRKGVDTVVEEFRRQSRYAQVDLAAAQEEYRQAWGREWINPYKRKAGRQLQRMDARHRAQEEMQRKIRLIRSVFYPAPAGTERWGELSKTRDQLASGQPNS